MGFAGSRAHPFPRPGPAEPFFSVHFYHRAAGLAGHTANAPRHSVYPRPAGVYAARLARRLHHRLQGQRYVLFFLLLPGTSSLAANCAALLALGLPEKLITLLQLVARHIVSLKREYTALTTAAALRGFTPAMHPRAWKTTAYLAAMLFIRCFDTAKRTEKAMLLRGFCGKLPLFLPETPQPQARDKWLLGGSVLCALLLILTNALPPTPL